MRSRLAVVSIALPFQRLVGPHSSDGMVRRFLPSRSYVGSVKNDRLLGSVTLGNPVSPPLMGVYVCVLAGIREQDCELWNGPIPGKRAYRRCGVLGLDLSGFSTNQDSARVARTDQEQGS